MAKTRNVARRLYLSFGALLVTLLLLLIVAYANFSRMVAAHHWNVHSYEVLMSMRSVAGDRSHFRRVARDIESTHDPKLVQSLQEERADFLTDFNDLQSLTTDNPGQQQHLHQLESFYRQWTDGYLKPLMAIPRHANTRFPASAAAPSLTLAQKNIGKQAMDGMRNMLREMRSAEEAQLNQRTRLAAQLQTSTARILAAGSVFAVLLAGGLSTLLARNSTELIRTNDHLEQEVAERTRAQAELRRAHDSLDARVQERTLELARTNAALREDMAQRALAEQKLEESQTRLRALAARLESVREEERTRLARELHDQLGQALTGLRMDLSCIEQRLPEAVGAADVRNSLSPTIGLTNGGGLLYSLREKTDSMARLIDDTIQLVGEIAAELRPAILDDLGLVAAIEWQAQDFGRRSGIVCAFTAAVSGASGDPELATAAFRILQEALTNVARHAKATQVHINLMESEGHLIMTVEDNGRGIPAGETFNLKSIGLTGMRERAMLLGGDVAWSRAEGGGTRVILRIPCDHPSPGQPQDQYAGFEPAAVMSPGQHGPGRNGHQPAKNTGFESKALQNAVQGAH